MSQRTASMLLASVLAAMLLAVPARADVVPGDRITPANAEKVKDLVSPAMYWCVQHGFPMEIIEPRYG